MNDPGLRGKTSTDGPEESENGRANITVALNTQSSLNSNGSDDEIFNGLVTVVHESFIHAYSDAEDFSDNGRFDFSNISQEYKSMSFNVLEEYQHTKVLNDFIKNPITNPNRMWPEQAYSIIMEYNLKNNSGRTPQKVINKMGDYRGGVNLDSKGNVKN